MKCSRFVRYTYAFVLSFAVLLSALHVRTGQTATDLDDRQSLIQRRDTAMNAYLKQDADEILLLSDQMRETQLTILAWFEQDHATLWDKMCNLEKELFGSKERYMEFLQVFESEFAVEPTAYWLSKVHRYVEPKSAGIGAQPIGMEGVVFDSNTGKLCPHHYTGRKSQSIVALYMSQVFELAWPGEWMQASSGSNYESLVADDLVFKRNEQDKASVPVLQHKIERYRANLTTLESFGITRHDPCDATSQSFSDWISHLERMVEMIEEQEYDCKVQISETRISQDSSHTHRGDYSCLCPYRMRQDR